MRQNFTPDPGTLFYPVSQRTVVYTTYGLFGKPIEKRDRTYAGDIFRCIAVDDVLIVAEVVMSKYSTGRITLKRSEFSCEPVGPQVAKALGLRP